MFGLQNRNITFPEQDDLNWKDITYRMGFVWDVRGDGKSAVKVAANKYLLGQTLNGFGASPNPANALAGNTFRSWSDNNNDHVVNCDLSNKGLQSPATTGSIDTCGAVSTNAFGSTVPLATFDPDLLTGWGHRPSNWEFSASIQQQLPKRMSVDVGYYRRIWQNFPVVDNTLVAASEFQAFTMTVPTDARLPNGGGNPADLLQRQSEQGRTDAELQHAVGQVRRGVRALERRGRQLQRPDAERPALPGRDQHRAYGRR